MPVAFRFVPVSGDLSGKSFEEQVEKAFNELGEDIDAISLEAGGATEVANQALGVAQQAQQDASAAEDSANQAVQTANATQAALDNLNTDVATIGQKADDAFNAAITATATANHAASTAIEAKAIADGIAPTANEALKNSEAALVTAEEARLAAEVANGTYVMVGDVDADQFYGSPDRMYVVGSPANIPLQAPLFLDIKVNDVGTLVTQQAWNTDTDSPQARSRIGRINFPLEDGAGSFSITAMLDSGTAIVGNLSIDVALGALSMNMVGGNASLGISDGPVYHAAVTLAGGAIENGMVTLNGENAIRIQDEFPSVIGFRFRDADADIQIDTAAVSGSDLVINVIVTWINTGASSVQWSAWQQSGSGDGGAILGDIRLMPFRVTELPEKWYFCNGDQYPLSSPQGVALAALSENFKTDWAIAASGENINLPNLFYSDGRGYFLRVGITPGGVENDMMRPITGYISNGGGYAIPPMASVSGALYSGYAGNWLGGTSGGSGTGAIYIDSSRLGARYSGSETAPIRRSMIPVIYLGV